MSLYDQTWPTATRGEQEHEEHDHTCFAGFCREPAEWQAPSGEWWCAEHACDVRAAQAEADRWSAWGAAMVTVFEDDSGKEE